MNTAPFLDRRLDLPWFRLTDAQGFVRVITPLLEGKETAVPGIVRYRDGSGRVGFVDAVRYQSFKTRVKPAELPTLLPRLSSHEVDRLFPRPAVEPASAVSKPVPRPAARPNAPRRPVQHAASRRPPAAPVAIVVRPRRTIVKDNH